MNTFVLKKKWLGRIIIFLWGSVSCPLFSQMPAPPAGKPNVLIISAHPDDWEAGMGGTAFLLKEKYKIHVLIATKGERGLSKEPSAQTAAIREKEARKACEMIGADLHFMGKIDQEVYADEAAVAQVTALLKQLDPVMIFSMWNIDVPDHAAAGTIARLALFRTGMIYDREVYFFEAGRGGQTNQFIPDFYVNVTSVKDKKDELIRCHACQNKEDKLVNAHTGQLRFHGEVARCDYAEAFKTFLPITNARWGKDPQYSLLQLETEKVQHLYDNNREVVIICCHPDDWEIAMGGTALKMKDKYHMHVLILTRGEKGLGEERTEEAIRIRHEHAMKTASMIHADLHIMSFKDGALTAEKEAVDSVIRYLEKINPGIIFCHWGMDKSDHAAASNICTKALASTGMIHDRQVYYFGVSTQTLSHFDPEIYVNITDVMDQKKEMIRIHTLPGHEEHELIDFAVKANSFYGMVNRCDYAEGFRTHYPLVNHRWNKKTLYELLDL